MQKTFLYAGKVRVFLALMLKGYFPDWQYLPRLFYFFITGLLFKPLRLLEGLIYHRKVARHKMTEDPIFILGHFRTGTTHLHNLLSCDPGTAFPTTFDTFAPGCFLVTSKWLKPLVRPLIPQKREMDNMEVSLDLPQEEEFSMLMVSPHSFYFQMFFPRHAKDFFWKYAVFSAASKREEEQWKAGYYALIRKFSFAYGGRRLLVKNPVNTARIPQLLELFPNARFIYISRNPYDVFPSTKHLHKKLMPFCQLQDIAFSEVETNIINFYRSQIKKYHIEKHKIPVQNLIEVKYEALEKEPVRVVEEIYTHLGLELTEAFKDNLKSYLKSIESYQKNVFRLTEEEKKKVEKYWLDV